MKKFLELISEEMGKGFETAGYEAQLGRVTVSNRPDLCEYQCNGAMAGAKKYHKAPIMIANDVAEKLADSAVFSEVSAVAPGFLNLKVKDSFVCEYLKEMAAAEKFGVEPPEKKKTIDDHESANLKKICDEVFGESNYLNQFAWVSNITGRQISGRGAAKTWEAVLAYARDIDACGSLSIDIRFAREKMPDAYKGFRRDVRTDRLGPFAVGDPLYNHNRKFNEETRPNLVFSIFYQPQTQEISTGAIGERRPGWVELPPHANGDGVHKYHAWRWSRQKIADEPYNLIVLPTASGRYEIHTKIRDFGRTLLKDVIPDIPNGDAELRKLFGGRKLFDYPKSVDLLRTLIGSVPGKDFVCLDLFSGSATTAHAVMRLNTEDGGHRSFIMVQLPEPCGEKSEAAQAGFQTICEIGKARIRRAGDQIRTEFPGACPDIGFRVFRVDEGCRKEVLYPPEEISQPLIGQTVSNIREDRTDLDLLYACLLDLGLGIHLPHTSRVVGGCTVHRVDGGVLGGWLSSGVPAPAPRDIAASRPQWAVFRDSAFASDAAKINVTEIFKSLSPGTRVQVL